MLILRRAVTQHIQRALIVLFVYISWGHWFLVLYTLQMSRQSIGQSDIQLRISELFKSRKFIVKYKANIRQYLANSLAAIPPIVHASEI